MSRLDDILDLIQTTNEVYFITAPGRVRTVFILVDDIVELALKTFLQEKALEQRESCKSDLESAGFVNSKNHRNNLVRYYQEEININDLSNAIGQGAAGVPRIQPILSQYSLLQHWSANDPNARYTFDNIIDEVKPFFVASSHPVVELLDEALERHKTRNKIYHDHHQSGLTIDDEKCLRGICEMFDLMNILFPDSSSKDGFQALSQHNKITRCQIGVLRLKLASMGSNELEKPYINALKQFNNEHKVALGSKNYEHSILHTISERFFLSLTTQMKIEISILEMELNKEKKKLERLRKPELINQHQATIQDKEYQLYTFKRQLEILQCLEPT